ncbi:efflux RND transporter periplasmic adaptor subunit [Shewanella sp. SR43-4]|nr:MULTISPECIES: efflux RND transporter periplasmic adaptor subunit [Shewanella]MBB1271017.1 efflux RND transporter periplasmic adaptor subunit [Shewanella sp. SR44-3]MBB1319827.1 efflux RND transporter periplasmic adaptor subunit [Shewanella sp. SR43-4]MCL1159913.1 efflux RND transporter periplasmic adaptor subunit [Shewanella inventionis]UAL43966.1 efflux RND transporter periplasmic adaptor subunit [Shewanella inventionis]
MNKQIKLITLAVLFCGITTITTATFANVQSSEKNEKHVEEKDDGHGHEAKNEEEEGAGVKLSKGQLTLAEINITVLEPQTMAYSIYAQGEIKANDYTSYLVSPRVDSVILKRHVALGDHVEINQPLVTLFSESMAEAQASYRLADSEWKRVQKLGRKAVGEKRFIEAQTDFEADLGRLYAFGLSTDAIISLTTNTKKLGQYTLNAETSGAVLSDNFRQGQRIESGGTLFELADEDTLWVEARLAPSMELDLPENSKAQVNVGNNTYIATITQKAHTIDPVTRTRIIRLQVQNVGHKLHPGLFADVYFAFETDKKVLTVPEEALMRGSDGDWMVFVEENGEFKGVEVELGRQLGKSREIFGLPSGTKVVTTGAFYVAAEIAKGSFDAHNH